MRNGRPIEELVDPVNLTVNTLCPDKWILVDTETGQTYRGNSGGYWDRLEPVLKRIESNDKKN